MRALEKSLGAAASLEPTAFAAVRESFERCLVLGAGPDASALLAKSLRRSLAKGMDAALEPLASRVETKKRLEKMRMKQASGAAGAVEIDDSDDPQPFYTAMAHVLSKASVALVEAAWAADTTDDSLAYPELQGLVETMAQDTSARARRVLSFFLDLSGVKEAHASATKWLQAEQPLGDGDRGGGDGERRHHRQLDIGVLDSLLEDVTELVALSHRFLAFLSAGSLGRRIDARAVSELPLFAEALGLAAMYVDMESAYLLHCLGVSVGPSSGLMEVSRDVHMASAAEDVFFVVRDKVLARAMATLSDQAVLALCSRVIEALDESAPPETSLYHAVSHLPHVPCGAALSKGAAEAFRAHRRAVAGDRRAAAVAAEEDRQGAPPGSGGKAGEGKAAVSVGDLVAGLAQQLDDEFTAFEPEQATRLLSLVVATNSADACALSMANLRSLMGCGAVLHESGLGPALAAKLAETSVVDLGRVEAAYAGLREAFVESLVDEFLAAPLRQFERLLQRRVFELDSSGNPVKRSTSDDPKKTGSSGFLGAMSGKVLSGLSETILSDSRADETSTTPLASLCQDTVFGSFAFFTVSATAGRGTPPSNNSPTPLTVSIS